MSFPVFDLHCDLLSYLSTIPEANLFDKKEIPCAIPYLQEGHVKTQICAIYTNVDPNSMTQAAIQAQIFSELPKKHSEFLQGPESAISPDQINENRISILAAIENAAGLGNETATWPEIYQQFDLILEKVGTLAYISLTHHTENRFGGGNYTEGIGLKEDGKKLLNHMDGKRIPIDLSHTSDLLAEGILNHIDQHNLDIPVIASHSNYRSIWNHKRNLSDEFAKEIIRREGIIGVNFLRAFLDNEVPERLFEHILHGFEIGGENSQCFGADFFYTKDFPDKSRHPFYFPLAENAGKYPSLLDQLKGHLTETQLRKLSFENAASFYQKLLN
ncbi:membrane dipeptidase [Algoriphagus sp. CAU 1675]|uniref:dipeptidase n=1 Tax=Algoriphagus sp. CAU 1675 TaxID=3032597 RepID=UPI0023DB3C97|nr:membrane dipeptidase [Algoriphagus sp. CAU 1675]MDF2156424.1 membrane dipeptidase [Algoriphagus sp. CAU 1675]